MELEKRIETAFATAIDAKRRMQENEREISNAEETAKMENLEEWTSAKNNDVRRTIILRELAEYDPYQEARAGYQRARGEYRLALLEVERLRLLVELAKAGAA